MASSDSNGMFQHQQPLGNTNNHSPNNHRHHHHHYHDEEAGGGPSSAKFGDYESSGDPFDIPQTKNASLETLKRWRQAALVLNASRRFRYTLDLKREEEEEQRRRMIRSCAQVTRAAVLFKQAGENQTVIGPSATPSTPSGDYGIGLEQLVSITRDHNISALQEYGGVKGVSQLLKTNLEKGITEDETDLIKRKNLFGSNTYPRKKGRSFLNFLWEAWKHLTHIILIVAAVLSLALGIITEGVQGWFDGGSIALAVFLVIIVTAVSDYRQSLQFQNLNDEMRNIYLEVFRGGRKVKISIFNIVVGDVVPLKMGDQVAADGILISGHSLGIDESSMTGQSKIVHKDHKAPFLMAGCKVAEGFGTMLVTGVGINTVRRLMMANISEDTGEEMPLQVRRNGVGTFIGVVGLSVAVFVLIILLMRYFTGHSKNEDGSVQYVRGVTSASKVAYGVIKIFTVAVTIVVVAIPQRLPLADTWTLEYSMRKVMADKALVVCWGRFVHENIQKFIQFLLTFNFSTLVINVVAAMFSGDVPLNVVQLLWVNVIVVALGELALATELPTNHLMHRSPVSPREPLITYIMWRSLFIQTIYQINVVLVIYFSGSSILRLNSYEREYAVDVKKTLIFNTFVLLQICNKFNARKPDEINVFSGVTKNRLFMGIVGITFVLQILIIEFLGRFTSTVKLNWKQWLISIVIAMISWPLAVVWKLIERSLVSLSRYSTIGFLFLLLLLTVLGYFLSVILHYLH